MKKIYIAQIVIFISLLGVFLYGFKNVNQGLAKEDTQRVKEAIDKAARKCYSIEGAYPQDIAYLKKHYGLFIQEDNYMIHYRYIAGNIMPDSEVYRKGD